MTRLVVIALLFSRTPAAAQTFEITPFLLGGYATSGSIDRKADGVQDLEVSGGYTWGAEGAYFVSPRLGFELMWTRQSTNVMMTTSTGSARLFDMKLDQFLGNVVYHFGSASATIRPFAFSGVGASRLSAQDVDTETKLAWTLGGGIKWFPKPAVGARAHVRYKPTRLNESSSSVCDPFGFCQGALQQFEFAGGLVLRF
jgi:outer membrane protein W